MPFTETGEAAFDEYGEPVKGRTPAMIVLPRFDFMNRTEFRAMMEAIEKATDADNKELSDTDRTYNVILATLAPYVSETLLKTLEEVPMGVLEQISSDWNESSSIKLGELRRSKTSAKSTKAASVTT